MGCLICSLQQQAPALGLGHRQWIEKFSLPSLNTVQPPAMPTEEHDYTHKDIWVALTGLSEQIKTLIKDLDRTDRSLEGEDGLLTRQRKLESQMAQVRLVGGLAVLLMPFAITGLVLAIGSHFLQARLAIPAAIERQEEGK